MQHFTDFILHMQRDDALLLQLLQRASVFTSHEEEQKAAVRNKIKPWYETDELI